MSKAQQKQIRKQPTLREDGDDPVNPDEPTTQPEWSEPQINWYREYLLNPDANAKISFASSDKKQEFEISLYKKIWGKTLAEGEDYPQPPENPSETGIGPEPYYTFTYGVNDIEKDNRGCQKSMIFGITFCHARVATTEGETTTYGEYAIKCGYLFIIAAFSQGEGETASSKVIVRTHQLVVIPNTEFWDGPINELDGAPKYHGIRVSEGDIVFGIKIEGNPQDSNFYFPRKSFFLEGRHQDPVPFIDNYDGSFALKI